MNIFSKLSLNIPFTEALVQMPSYIKFMKQILLKKRRREEFGIVALNEECSTVLYRKISPKLKDPSRFIFTYLIGSNFSRKALYDLGSNIKSNALVYLQEVRTRRSETYHCEIAVGC